MDFASNENLTFRNITQQTRTYKYMDGVHQAGQIWEQKMVKVFLSQYSMATAIFPYFSFTAMTSTSLAHVIPRGIVVPSLRASQNYSRWF